MVCPIVCIPLITILAWLSDLLGIEKEITALFLGALIVGLSEVESNWLFKIAEKKGKKYLFPFQTAIITILNLMTFAFVLVGWKIL